MLLSDPGSLVERTVPETARGEYVSRVIAGGFPPVLKRARSRDRADWFDDYVELAIERDVLDVSRVQQRRQSPLLLLRQLAGRTAQVLNITNAARAIVG